MTKVYVFEVLILMLFGHGVLQSYSTRSQRDVFKTKLDQLIKSGKQGRFNENQNAHRGIGPGRLHNDDTKLNPTKVNDNSSKLQNESVSSIVNETLSKVSNGTQGNMTVSTLAGKIGSSIGAHMKTNAKIPSDRLNYIVNNTLFKVLNNDSRDDPSGGTAEDDQGSGSGSGFITCEMCPACVGCVVMAVPPDKVFHAQHFNGNPCLHGGELQEFPNGTFTCMCPIGYRGTKCGDLVYCHSNPCHNNGTCIEDAHGFKCVCPKGFKGTTCDEFSSCEPNPCENDGICIQIDNNFTCACKAGYLGDRCKDTDPCFINPCKNGGTCSVVKGKANCTCPVHHTGNYCQVETVCYNNPCQNGATCVENPTRPCICAKGFAGRYCSEHVCHINPCFHGGACEVTKAIDGGDDEWTYKCKCPVFFLGKNCEVPNFCKGDPCKNRGTCVDLYKQNMLSKRWLNHMQHQAYYKCICPPGYKGKQCESTLIINC